MKYFKDPDLNIYAFEEDGSQDHLITSNLTNISENEVFELKELKLSKNDIIQKYISMLQTWLDNFVKTRGYNNLLSACTYYNSTNPKFKTEGEYALKIRDQVWDKCYSILAEVNNGTKEINSFEDLLKELPVLKWPD